MVEFRVFFKKIDRMRFVSHLDLNRAFTRALFASQLPVWFTEGFNRHPHLVFGQPLPLGMAGEMETMDMRMNEPIDGDVIVEELNKQLPSGIRVVRADTPKHAHKEICFAKYRIELDDALFEPFMSFWSAESIMAEKKTKRASVTVDLKKEIREISFERADGRFTICANMPCSFECSIGPAVLLRAFEATINDTVFAYQTRERFLLGDYSDFC